MEIYTPLDKTKRGEKAAGTTASSVRNKAGLVGPPESPLSPRKHPFFRRSESHWSSGRNRLLSGGKQRARLTSGYLCFWKAPRLLTRDLNLLHTLAHTMSLNTMKVISLRSTRGFPSPQHTCPSAEHVDFQDRTKETEPSSPPGTRPKQLHGLSWSRRKRTPYLRLLSGEPLEWVWKIWQESNRLPSPAESQVGRPRVRRSPRVGKGSALLGSAAQKSSG